MGEEEVAGIGLGLDLDTSGWSAGIAKARAEVGVLKQDLKSLGVAGRINIARQRAQLSGQNAISPQFQTSRGAVQQLRVDVNSHLRAMAQTGESITVPIRLGRVPYATMRSQIIRGLGEIPVTIRLSGISGGQGALAALISTSTGESMGKAQSTIESAAASRGIPRRAMGGSVMPNTPYLVGEHGRAEMFVPRGAGGKIVGSSELQRLMAAAARLQPHNVAGGKSWYSTAGSYAASAAERYGVPLKMAQGLLAALSVGTEWNSNKTKFERILAARASGSPIPYNDTKFVAHRFAGEILRGADPAHVFRTSPKVSQFYAGISGNRDALVLDRWATRTMKGWQPGMPTGGAWDRPPRRGPAREAAEAAWREAAQSTGLSPAEFQAALWLQEKEQGQLALGLASGGRVAPGQRGMFEAVPRPGYCPWCRVNIAAGKAGAHYRTTSHREVVQGRRRPYGSSMRSLKSEKRIAAMQQARRNPDEDHFRRSVEDSMSTTELGASAQLDLGENRPYEGRGTFIPGYAGGGFIRQAYESTLANSGGTFDRHGVQPPKGYAVAFGQGPIVSANDPGGFARAFHNVYKAAGRSGRTPFVGTWRPEGSDEIQIDMATVLGRKRQAEQVALREAQIAAFDLKRFEEVFPKWNARHPSPGQTRLPGFAQGGPAHRGGLPRGYSLDFMVPNEGQEMPWHALAGANPDRVNMVLKKLDKPEQFSPAIMALARKGQNIVASAPFTFDVDQQAWHPQSTFVDVAHRRKGLATAMYSKLERFTGHPVMPSDVQTTFGKALWAQTKRAFGQPFAPRYKVSGFDQTILAEYGRQRALGMSPNSVSDVISLSPLADKLALENRSHISEPEQPLMASPGTVGGVLRLSRRGRYADAGPSTPRYTFTTDDPIHRAKGGWLNALRRDTAPWTDPRTRRFGMSPLGYDFVQGRGYISDQQWPSRDPRNSMPMALMPFSKNAAGGGVPPGTVIAGEIGRELFVPRTKQNIIPPEVMAQLPKRGGGGEVEEIAPGAHLWQAPEDGWIIPNRLMNKVPRRQDGGPADPNAFGGGGFGSPEAQAKLARLFPRRAKTGHSLATDIPIQLSDLREQMLAASPGVPKGVTDLSEFQAFKRENPNVRGLTPRSVLGGILGRVASGKERAEAENALREAAATLRGFHTAAGDVEPLKLWTGFMEKAQARVNENAQALSKFTTASQKSSRTFLDLTAQQAKAQKDLKYATETKADIERQEITIRLAERKLELTPASQLRQFAVLQGGFTLYQLALTGVSKALQLGEMAADPFIDRLNGFTGVATDITAKLAQQTRELGGNAQSGVATAAQGTSIGSAGLSYLNQNLTGPTTAKAAATSESTAADLRRAALSFASGASTATGLFGPYGGIGPVINGEQVGSSPGLTDTMGKEIADLNNRRVAAEGHTNPMNDLGAVATGAGAGALVGGGAGLLGGPFAPISVPAGAAVGALAGGAIGAIGAIGGDIGTQLNANPRQVAAIDQLETATVKDWNDAVKTGSQYLGDNASSLQYMTKQQLIAAGDIKDTDWGAIVDQFKSVGTAAGDTATDLENMTGGPNGVVIWNTATNKLIGAGESLYAGAKEYTKTASQLAQGAVLGSQQAFFQPHLQEFLGGVKQGILQGTFQRQVQIPGALGLQLAANPFSPASTGFAPDQQKALGAKLAAIDKEQNDLTAMGQAGLKAQSSFVHQWALTVGPQALNAFSKQFLAGQVQGPPTQALGPGGQIASPDQNLAATYDNAVADVGKYGAAIAGLNAEISNTEAGLAFKQYGNDIRILNRSLRDARSLLKSPSASQLTAGADNAGAIQRAEFDVSRAQQSLSFQLSQRQINFQTAVAGFQAPGITGQERAARTIEAQTEASFAQKQLDLQREQFKLEGVAFVVEAQRAVVDVRASIDLERAARDAQTKILADQKLISTDQVRLSQAQAVATSILDQASGNYQSATDLAAARVKEFGGNIQDATNQLRVLLGLSPENTSYNQQGQIVTTTSGGYSLGAGKAQGGSFLLAGGVHKAAAGLSSSVDRATGFIAGEAGVGEHVIVMKNPRYGSVAAAGVPGSSGSGFTVGPIYITGNTIKDTVDLHDIATQLTDEIERRLGQKARVVLPRSASF